ncbi:hypothetical protein [Actinomadura montaniterrae]|uniref:hypothetical protein n=1 Tax=Actinomadura montaniterrae TaxID=1803903 RepID=UPI001CEFAD8D|nr:hypothetical protein [Actinomadura montaniterrae]
MRTLRCLDGSVLDVVPVASLDRGGTPFEVTLELRRDGDRFGAVGERCGYFLADLARRVDAARADGSPQAARWPDPDDRFPDPPAGGGGPREPELFAFRYRDRGDVISTGELRCALRTSSMWVGRQQSAAGRWRVARRAVIEAWGASGRGVRAVLTSAELARFLAAVLADVDRAGASATPGASGMPGASGIPSTSPMQGVSGTPGVSRTYRTAGPARYGRATRPAR